MHIYLSYCIYYWSWHLMLTSQVDLFVTRDTDSTWKCHKKFDFLSKVDVIKKLKELVSMSKKLLFLAMLSLHDGSFWNHYYCVFGLPFKKLLIGKENLVKAFNAVVLVACFQMKYVLYFLQWTLSPTVLNFYGLQDVIIWCFLLGKSRPVLWIIQKNVDAIRWGNNETEVRTYTCTLYRGVAAI